MQDLHNNIVRVEDMKGRIISGAIAIAYLIGAYTLADVETTFRLGIFLIFPLACIWFSDAMGQYTGLNFLTRPAITKSTPGWLIAFGGWILLFLPIVIGLIVTFTGNE